MINKTICSNCGRLVNLAPAFCQLCGSDLGESTRVLFVVNSTRCNDYTLPLDPLVWFQKAA